jgi:hypothetical protein
MKNYRHVFLVLRAKDLPQREAIELYGSRLWRNR